MLDKAIAKNRIVLRLKSEDKNMLQSAAFYEGVSLSTFIRKAALEAAHCVVARHECLTLSFEDAVRISAALDRPFELNEALSKAMKAAAEIEGEVPVAQNGDSVLKMKRTMCSFKE